MSIISRVTAFAGLACVSGVSFAQSDFLLPQGLTADQIGYVYYDVATGEMTRTARGPTRGLENPIWINTNAAPCPDSPTIFAPLRNSATGLDTWWMDWGDIQSNTLIDTVTILYLTDVRDPGEDGEEGFELNIAFFDGVDTDQIIAGVEPFVQYAINVPGSQSGMAAWLITLTFGTCLFEIGDTDGVDLTGHRRFSDGMGIDRDGDELSDFAYGIGFRHPESAASGFSGVALVKPGAMAPGDVDSSALFDGDGWDTFDGFFDFGGFACDTGGIFGWTPWSSIYVGLYGPTDFQPCLPDVLCDRVLDFYDIQLFLQYFASGDIRADFTGDGVIDFPDVQLFLTYFADGCP